MEYEIFIPYHDEEWGRPCFDDLKLFEMLCLEMMQAGLSWRTVLVKRQALNLNFADFQPEKIVSFSAKKIEQLMQEPAIIRHRAKINAVVNNAEKFMALKAQKIRFSDFVWSVVKHKPVINRWKTQSQVPAKTEAAEQLTALLKKQGFKFLGATTIYAFMQATGMVNDHLVDCFCADIHSK